MNTRRNNIELLRFCFAVMIVIHHSVVGGGTYLNWPHAYNGWLGCEFFFILSGYFMANKVRSITVNGTIQGWDELRESWLKTLKYSYNNLSHSLKSIWGIYLLSSLQGCLIRNIFRVETDWITQVKAIPGEVFLLQCLGVPVSSYTGVAWYLSAYLIATFILYPLLRRYYYFFCSYIAPFVSVTIWSTLLATYGTLSPIMN